MEQPNGETHECVFITEDEKEVINLFRRNESSLKEYLEQQEDYIASLEEVLYEVENSVWAAYQNGREHIQTAASSKVPTLADIKKATRGNE